MSEKSHKTAHNISYIKKFYKFYSEHYKNLYDQYVKNQIEDSYEEEISLEVDSSPLGTNSYGECKTETTGENSNLDSPT